MNWLCEHLVTQARRFREVTREWRVTCHEAKTHSRLSELLRHHELPEVRHHKLTGGSSLASCWEDMWREGGTTLNDPPLCPPPYSQHLDPQGGFLAWRAMRCTPPSVSSSPQALHDLAWGLEGVLSGVAEFLEEKRGRFPRFYFLSSTEMIDVLVR